MNADIKAKWVTALRSGEYEQTTGTLHSRDAYCCLGVLCDLAVKANAAPAWALDDPDDAESGYVIGDESSTLPPAVQQWAGLANTNPNVDYTGHGYVALAELNDAHELPFPAIADVIEAQL